MRKYLSASLPCFCLAAFFAFLSAAPGAASDECSEPSEYHASKLNSISGFSQAKLNQQNNLIITLDHNADSYVDRIYRIHLINKKQRRHAISRWSTGEIELQVLSWSIGDRKFHNFLPIQSQNGFSIASNRFNCVNEFIASQEIPLSPLYRRSAISVHYPGILQAMSHRSALKSFEKNGIFSDKGVSAESSKEPLESRTTSGPLFCAAGGEGASGCSISFGGIGGLTTGSCSVSGCEAPSFACCGPGWGSNCVCRQTEDSGTGGNFGDPGDGSGGTDGTGGGTGAEDECDQEDPPTSCDTSEEDSDEIDP